VLLGLDAVGKTTFLYRLKGDQNEVVTTIPTIGFSVETIILNRVDFKCWDVGACDQVRPLWRPHMQNLDFFMFIFDSNDLDRAEKAHEELRKFLQEDEVVFSPKRPIGVLILANKQDMPCASNCLEVAKLLHLNEDFMKRPGYYWHVLPTCMIDGPKTEEEKREKGPYGGPWVYVERPETVHYLHFQEVLDLFAARQYNKLFEKFGGVTSFNFEALLAEEANAVKNGPNGDASQSKNQITKHVTLLSTDDAKTVETGNRQTVIAIDDQLLEHERKKRELIWQEWLSRAAVLPITSSIDMVDSDEHFIAALADCSLTTWDHLTHIRIAWIFIRRYGLEQGFKAIEESISHYIQHGGRTDGKSFHPTMTRFWCHMIAYWLIRWQLKLHDRQADEEPSSYRPVDNNDTFSRQSAHPFHQFLRYVYEERDFHETDITNGALFKVYFSPSVIFAPSAKSEIVRPDVKNLVDFREYLVLLPSSSVLKKEQDFLTRFDYWQVLDTR
jgi:GTPase SAR1 family protein